MDVMQNAVGLASRLGAGPFVKQHAAKVMTRAAVPACSTVVAWGDRSADGTIKHARNFDFPGNGVWDSAPSLVLCAPSGGMRYGFVATRGADTPVVSVWNEAGLVFTTHTRFHRDVRWGGATIVDLMHALAARAETLDDAIAIARERPVSSTWGICASSARERKAIVIEIHGRAVEIVEPSGDLLTCANRYRHPRMQDGEATASHAWAMHSDARERRLRELAGSSKSDAMALARMLDDRIDPNAPGVVRRVGGVIAQPINVHAIVVEPEARSLLLAVGRAPACDGPWLRVSWDWSGPVGAWELPAHPPGITIDSIDPGTKPDEASVHLAEVARLEQTTHDADAMAAALDRAIACAPDDPSLRLSAVWVQMARGDHARAIAEAKAGLAIETIPYRRGQLLLWGARAASVTRDALLATAWRDELDGIPCDELEDLKRRARADRRRRMWSASRRPDASLFMADAH